MTKHLYSVTLIPGTDAGPFQGGIHEYELRNSANPDVVICQMRLPLGDGGFWNGLLNAQAEKAWELGAEAMCGQDNGGPMAENPFTIPAPEEAEATLAAAGVEPADLPDAVKAVSWLTRGDGPAFA